MTAQFVVVSPGRWDRAAWDLRAGRRGPGTADWSPVSREFSAAWGRGAELPGLRSLRSALGPGGDRPPGSSRGFGGPGNPLRRGRGEIRRKECRESWLKVQAEPSLARAPSACAAFVQGAQVHARARSLRPRDGRSAHMLAWRHRLRLEAAVPSEDLQTADVYPHTVIYAFPGLCFLDSCRK